MRMIDVPFIFYGAYGNGFLWIRFKFINGHGFLVKDITRHRKLFSERLNIEKHVMIGKWLIRVLK